MNIDCSADVAALCVHLQEVEVVRSSEPVDGAMVDYDGCGKVVGVEFLDASRRLDPDEAAWLLNDSGPNSTKTESRQIRSIQSRHTRISCVPG